MKKLIKMLLFILILFPVKILAAGGFNVSSSNITMYVGETKSITVSASNSAGRLDISSSSSATSISSSSIFLDNDSVSISITGNSIGSSIIKVVASSNFATYDEEILSGQTKTITVNVIARQTSSNNNNSGNNSNNNNNSNSNNNNNSSNNGNKQNNIKTTTVDNLSKNNNLKEISVEGYKLVKVDNNNYMLTVSNNVSSINVKATSEDAKAKIAGMGSHEIQIGENNIELIVTSESGLQNKINIKVTRKDAYYIEDLDEVIKNTSLSDITILKDSKITKNDLKKIKDSKRIIRFNYYDDTKKNLYSLIIDGSKLKKIDDLLSTISFDSENKKSISKLSNYADGIYISFLSNDDFKEGLTLRLYVGNKYENKDKVNAYYYDKKNNKLNLISNNISVKDGYIEFSANNLSDYFITMSNINNEANVKKSSPSYSIFIVIMLVLIAIILIGLLIYFLLKKKNKSGNFNNVNNENIIKYEKSEERK